MVPNEAILKTAIFYFILILLYYTDGTELKGNLQTQDQTTSRANTLIDDADDLQKQLDNEARDRLNNRPKTLWVFRFPTQYPVLSSVDEVLRRPRRYFYPFTRTYMADEKCEKCEEPPPKWDYCTQHKWGETFPACAGRSQSPVTLPVDGLVKAKAGRPLIFCNYDTVPKSLYVEKSEQRVVVYGDWDRKKRPLVYGGAAHSRRYLFYSLTLHWPSEHAVGGLNYPMETQLLHISADYSSFEEAVEASSSDPQAFLMIVNIYKFDCKTQKGLKEILKKAGCDKDIIIPKNITLEPMALREFSPPFNMYACYQGSLTIPPCTESVLWMIRGRTMSVTREDVNAAQSILGDGHTKKQFFRFPQPLNDRRIYFFSS